MNERPNWARCLAVAAAAWWFVCGTGAGGEAPKKIDPDAGCSNKTCHAEIAKTKHLHGPVAAGECTACHESEEEDRHEFTIAAEGKELCEACHDPIENRKIVHEPVADDCMTCHSPHGGDNKAFLMAQGPELCATCHDEVVEQAREAACKHSPVLDKRGCVTCHEPHASDIPKRLKKETMDLCLSCHDKEIKTNGRTIHSVKDEISAGKSLHGPVEERSCETCHDPHGARYAGRLKAAYPHKFYAPFSVEAYALCLECHGEEIATEARTEDGTEFRNGTLNLHHLHVSKKIKGRTCRTCHATHAAAQPHLLRKSVPFGKSGWSIPIRFKGTETGGTCATGCHAPRSYDREKPVDYGAD